MEFEKAEKNGNKTIFHLKDASVAQANAIRRLIYNSMPAFAIDEVDVYENTSPLFNEYIASRMALVPLTYDDDVSSDAKISFTVDAQGPCTVHSEDLKTTDEKIKVFLKNIPVIKLGPNQRFKAEATAIKSTAATHAKFQTALASYSYYPELAVNKNCNDCKDCVKACPKHAIGNDIKLEKPHACDLCATCEEICPKEAIKIKPKEGEFSFAVETYNNLSPEQHLKTAVSILKQKAKELAKQLK